jgi:large subunit ribosomal protein L15
MPHKLRKTRKKRGTRTQGYGRIGQHRKSGSKSRRKAGRHKHGWSYIQRYEPDYFKKDRFKGRLPIQKTIINLKDLEGIAVQLKPKKRTKKTRIFLDLENMGYDKLLGTGKISTSITVKVPSISEIAQRKIEEAGGEILTENV